MRIKIIRILAAIVGALGLWAVAYAAQAATLTLSPATANLSIGDTLTVNVTLDTQGQSIDGVDIKYLRYNPYYLQLVDADSATAGTQIAAGTLMPNTLENNADTQNGKISFSQITNGGSHYTGSGVLATLTFKALVVGTAAVTIDATPGNTTDSNVASNGTDVLTSVTNGSYVIAYPTVTPGGGGDGGGGGGGGTTSPPPVTPPITTGSGMRLINDNGTYYLVINNVLHGITNPGMLDSYGFIFAQGKLATDADRALSKGSLLTPNDGSLVKSQADPTVYLISNQQRYGFVSEAVFKALGFKFSSVLVVTNPELQILPKSSNLDQGSARHLSGLDINRNGTVYWIGQDNQLHGYPSLIIYNSWHIPNDFTKVVPANAADMALPVGSLIDTRVVN